MTMNGKWTLDFNFSVFPLIIIATSLHCCIATLQHCYIAWHLLSGYLPWKRDQRWTTATTTTSRRPRRLQLETQMLSATAHENNQLREGRQLWLKTQNIAIFYLTFWEAFKCAQKYAWIRKNFFWNVWRPLTEPSPSNSCSFVLIWLFIWLKDLKPQLEMTKDILNISVMNL